MYLTLLACIAVYPEYPSGAFSYVEDIRIGTTTF